MKVGLFFGSYNPIHIGHLAIANYFLEFSDFSRIWLVVSPQSPFKAKQLLLPENQRYHLTQLALEDDAYIQPSSVEFHLPKPSYTIDTMNYLKEKYPANAFCLIMGADNLYYFHKWKGYTELNRQFPIYIYPRLRVNPEDYKRHYNLKLVNAPLIEISSSFIRESIQQGKNLRYFLPAKVYHYIQENRLYEK